MLESTESNSMLDLNFGVLESLVARCRKLRFETGNSEFLRNLIEFLILWRWYSDFLPLVCANSGVMKPNLHAISGLRHFTHRNS